MKLILRLIVVMCIGWLFFAGCSGDKEETGTAIAFPDSIVDDDVITLVNGNPITGRDLRVFAMVYGAGTPDSLRDQSFNLQLLDGLIDRTLLFQEASAVGTVVEDSTSQWYINEFTRSVGGEQALTGYLGSSGVSRFEFEKSIKKDLVLRKFFESKFSGTVQVTDSLAQAYYVSNPQVFVSPDSVHARHIILLARADDTESTIEQKRQTLLSIRGRVVAGESFADLAREYSEGPSAPTGGDLGTFTRQTMVKPFSDVAFNLKPGEISDVVETQFGYHLIMVDEKFSGRKLDYAEVRTGLLQQIREHSLATNLQNHLQRSRAAAIIENKY